MLRILAIAVLLFMCSTAAMAQVTLSPPVPLGGEFEAVDATSAWWTYASDINVFGFSAGMYATGDPGESPIMKTYGFVRTPGGTMLPVDAPGADSTSLVGINNIGWIAGRGIVLGPDDGSVEDDETFNFIRFPGGHFRTIETPGDSAAVRGLGPFGDLAGSYYITGPPFEIHGFVRTLFGRVITLDVPGASRTWATGVNGRRQVVGNYRETVPPEEPAPDHGFYWARGSFNNIDIPGSTYTIPHDINERRQIAGTYGVPVPAGGEPETRGFLIMRDGTVYSIQFPGALITGIHGINYNGVMVGGYRDSISSVEYHGFIFRPEFPAAP